MARKRHRLQVGNCRVCVELSVGGVTTLELDNSARFDRTDWVEAVIPDTVMDVFLAVVETIIDGMCFCHGG